MWALSAHIEHSILHQFSEVRNDPEAYLSKTTGLNVLAKNRRN